MKPVHGLILLLLLVTVGFVPGCSTGISVREIAREDPAAATATLGPAKVGALCECSATVARSSRSEAWRCSRATRLRSASNGAAVIYFANQGEVVAAGATRVRIGSLEVLFGRVFAKVRGLFTISSENVVAGVEGTSFLFQLEPGPSVRVAVADGTVICRPRVGTSWAPLRLSPGQELAARFPPADRWQLSRHPRPCSRRLAAGRSRCRTHLGKATAVRAVVFSGAFYSVPRRVSLEPARRSHCLHGDGTRLLTSSKIRIGCCLTEGALAKQLVAGASGKEHPFILKCKHTAGWN